MQGLTVNDQGKTIALVKNNGVWYIGDAGGQEADGIHVGTVVDSLVNLQATRVLTDTAEALSAYGLEQPPTSIVLSLPNNQLQTLTIGSKNPDGSLYYLQKKGDAKVYLSVPVASERSQGAGHQPAHQADAGCTVESDAGAGQRSPSDDANAVEFL